MKNLFILTMLAVLCFSGILYGGDWDFYSDGVIEDGDTYNVVGIYDTPPDHTTVDMTGGLVDSMGVYDESTLNVSGGTVWSLYSFESSTANVFGGSIYGLYSYDMSAVYISDNANVEILRARGSSVVDIANGLFDIASASEFGEVNIYGGLVNDYLASDELGIINVYGYGLGKSDVGGIYGNGSVWGEWANGNLFSIDFNGTETYSHVELHEIPEPCSMFLLGVGGLLIKNRKK